MPAYKVLAQLAPAATTASTLYTATNQTIISTLNVSNFGGVQDTIRIAVRPAGATLANQHYIAFDVPLAAGAVFSLQGGITLGNTDVVTVRSTSGGSAFSAFGSDGN
jgi:hypothetical protein